MVIGHSSPIPSRPLIRIHPCQSAANSSAPVRVAATELGGLSVEGPITIYTTDVNEAPSSVSPASVTIVEGMWAATADVALGASDPDIGDSCTFSIIAGVDSADPAFGIDFLGRIYATHALDAAEQTNYTVTVRATDRGGLYADGEVTIYVVEAASGSAGSGGDLDINAVPENQEDTPGGYVRASTPDDRTSIPLIIEPLSEEEAPGVSFTLQFGANLRLWSDPALTVPIASGETEFPAGDSAMVYAEVVTPSTHN